MLRITKIESAQQTTLRLDGRIAGIWLQELRSTCEPLLGNGHALVIDCGGISFIDGPGLQFMRSLRQRNVPLVRFSPFLELQMKEEATA